MKLVEKQAGAIIWILGSGPGDHHLSLQKVILRCMSGFLLTTILYQGVPQEQGQ